MIILESDTPTTVGHCPDCGNVIAVQPDPWETSRTLLAYCSCQWRGLPTDLGFAVQFDPHGFRKAQHEVPRRSIA